MKKHNPVLEGTFGEIYDETGRLIDVFIGCPGECTETLLGRGHAPRTMKSIPLAQLANPYGINEYVRDLITKLVEHKLDIDPGRALNDINNIIGNLLIYCSRPLAKEEEKFVASEQPPTILENKE